VSSLILTEAQPRWHLNVTILKCNYHTQVIEYAVKPCRLSEKLISEHVHYEMTQAVLNSPMPVPLRCSTYCGHSTAKPLGQALLYKTRCTGTVHTSAKACLTSVAIRIREPDHQQNIIICSLAYCQPSLKISCNSVQKLCKVAKIQTNGLRLHILHDGGN